jgi:hypothetical protein
MKKKPGGPATTAKRSNSLSRVQHAIAIVEALPPGQQDRFFAHFIQRKQQALKVSNYAGEPILAVLTDTEIAPPPGKKARRR